MKVTYLLIIALFYSCAKGGNGKGSSLIGQNSNYSEEEGKVNSRASFKFDHIFKSFENKQKSYGPSDDRYTSLVVTRDPKSTELNHQVFDRGLRTVDLAGIDLELGRA